jgi:hypothetical protein
MAVSASGTLRRLRTGIIGTTVTRGIGETITTQWLIIVANDKKHGAS